MAQHAGATRHIADNTQEAKLATLDKQVTFKVDSMNPTKFSSLPRRKSPRVAEFARDDVTRQSAGTHERCVEYFVPRSLSDFNLSRLSSSGPCNGPVGGRIRDKVVTFEDAPHHQPGDVFM